MVPPKRIDFKTKIMFFMSNIFVAMVMRINCMQSRINPNDSTAESTSFAVRSFSSDEAEFPELFPLVDMLRTWNNDDTREESYANPQHTSLRVFDFMTERELMIKYRDLEIPFVVENVPELEVTMEKWTDEYLSARFEGETAAVETAPDNKFMYSTKTKKIPEGYVVPTTKLRMSFDEWIDHARAMDAGEGGDYFYFYANGQQGKRGNKQFIVDDLKFLNPVPGPFMANDVSGHAGINCRFGMRGISAAGHYDSKRNFVAIMRGKKRYILGPPTETPNFVLYPRGHPSARHTMLDFSDPDLEKFPQFAEAQATQVVLEAGQLLYIPSFWFHHIVSLTTNLQCNSRSSVGERFRDEMAGFGFPM